MYSTTLERWGFYLEIKTALQLRMKAFLKGLLGQSSKVGRNL